MDLEITKKQNQSEWKSLIVVILIALSIRILVIEPFFVPTGSMKETILEGDYIFSSKFSYGYSRYSFPFSPNLFSGRIFASEPQRGDIIIFRPPHNMNMRYIKRLVGLPGDKIQLVNDLIYINDEPIEREDLGLFTGEDGTLYKRYRETLPGGFKYITYKTEEYKDNPMVNRYGTTPVFYVPSGQYFFLGDNRYNSIDSRFDLGFVPFENFIAKGQFFLFSTKEWLWRADGTVLDPITRLWPWLKSIRFNRIFKSIYNNDI